MHGQGAPVMQSDARVAEDVCVCVGGGGVGWLPRYCRERGMTPTICPVDRMPLLSGWRAAKGAKQSARACPACARQQQCEEAAGCGWQPPLVYRSRDPRRRGVQVPRRATWLRWIRPTVPLEERRRAGREERAHGLWPVLPGDRR